MRALTMDLHISRPVKMLIAGFLLILFVAGVWLPMTRKQDGLAARLVAAHREYRGAVTMSAQYRAAAFQQAESGTALQEPIFSYLERVTRDLNLEGKVDSIRPENKTGGDGEPVEAVHVAFKGITLDEFVTFLYHIEVLKREIYIQDISIKKDGQNNLITQMTLLKFD
ncbi:hypothetical protein [Salidesulfovibrio onnuriiensis]|uniref:hypothetical protein n=1 Tax=Salidesulfovibrio onnuriiensis TaxID=2583823 RepID=UPI0011CA9BE8|nr:hypothetical protein [Salidesulfovibrio onnuriiensis]